MADSCQLEKSKNETGNKPAIINVKKLQFIHTVNGDGSKTAKIIKGNVNHTNTVSYTHLTLPTIYSV